MTTVLCERKKFGSDLVLSGGLFWSHGSPKLELLLSEGFFPPRLGARAVYVHSPPVPSSASQHLASSLQTWRGGCACGAPQGQAAVTGRWDVRAGRPRAWAVAIVERSPALALGGLGPRRPRLAHSPH